MIPFGKQQEILDFLFDRQIQKSCRETAGTLFIEFRTARSKFRVSNSHWFYFS
jgi:hypothetical protein